MGIFLGGTVIEYGMQAEGMQRAKAGGEPVLLESDDHERRPASAGAAEARADRSILASKMLERAAARCGMPLTVHRVVSEEAGAPYQRHLVPVRPDGHVARRGDTLPDDAIVDTVRSAGSRIGPGEHPSPNPSLPGLTRQSIFFEGMDARVEPGHDKPGQISMPFSGNAAYCLSGVTKCH
jgi:hypothetical protein